jgi:curved DNA-binding protein CbpA
MDTNNCIDEEEPMNIQIALNLLDIKDIELTNLTTEYVKRKYHKMALRWHPDKNGNTSDATKRFQRINEAHTYLSKELTKDSSSIFEEFVSSSDSKDEKKYVHFFIVCFYFQYSEDRDKCNETSIDKDYKGYSNKWLQGDFHEANRRAR